MQAQGLLAIKFFLLLQELGIGRLEVLRQACSSKLGLAPAALKLFELREVPVGAELSADAAQIGVMVEGSGEMELALTVLSGVPQSAAKGRRGAGWDRGVWEH